MLPDDVYRVRCVLVLVVLWYIFGIDTDNGCNCHDIIITVMNSTKYRVIFLTSWQIQFQVQLMDVENVEHFNKLDKTACPLESVSNYREMRLIQLHCVSVIFPCFFNGFTHCSFVIRVCTSRDTIPLQHPLVPQLSGSFDPVSFSPCYCCLRDPCVCSLIKFIYVSCSQISFYFIIVQNVRKVWNKRELYLLFTLYALYVHPDTAHFFQPLYHVYADCAQNI
jgi:hypothetical protein